MNAPPASKMHSLLLLLAASVFAVSLPGCGREEEPKSRRDDALGRIDRSSTHRLTPDEQPAPQQQPRRNRGKADEPASPTTQSDHPTRPEADAEAKAKTTQQEAPASQSDTRAASPQPDTHTSDAGATNKTPANDPWPIPEGPLDDEKYVEISAKYAAAVQSLSQTQRTSQNTHAILKSILKQANVTQREYETYTDQVAQEPERARQVADAIETRVRHRTAHGWEWQPRREAPAQ